jgi:hypothetical protein
VVDAEVTSLVKYVHILCGGCEIRRRFKDEAAVIDLALPDIKLGKGMPALLARVFK